MDLLVLGTDISAFSGCGSLLLVLGHKSVLVYGRRLDAALFLSQLFGIAQKVAKKLAAAYLCDEKFGQAALLGQMKRP